MFDDCISCHDVCRLVKTFKCLREFFILLPFKCLVIRQAGVVQWLAESKRQAKLLAVISAQRDIKARESARIDAKEKESKQQVRIKELVILDLTKRCNELSNRLKEFSALYEVVKNERNKYVNLIQSSAQALAEMREKIRILHNEVRAIDVNEGFFAPTDDPNRHYFYLCV